MIQWHPIFASLLRPLLEPRYEVRTEVPVGDAPRVADLVLIRRTTAAASAGQGLWNGLTTWNVLEFKGPTVSPRRGDLRLLVELGLGITRRLNEERVAAGQREYGAEEVAFWFLANRLGQRFLRIAESELDVGALQPVGPGVWRCRVLRHLVFLVSGTHLPVERDSLPLHVLARASHTAELQVARLVGAEPPLWKAYGPLLLGFHPDAVEELLTMARTTNRKFDFHIEGFIKAFGLGGLIDKIGLERIVEQVGTKKLVEELGTKKLVEEVGTKKLVEELGVDRIFASMSPAERRAFKRKMEE
jgi:hypothetical protein